MRISDWSSDVCFSDLQISQTRLTGSTETLLRNEGLPDTFVPGRNLLFLTLAAALAYRRGLKHIVTGVCETDFSGYPDCRDDTIKALQVAINLGTAAPFVIHRSEEHRLNSSH